MLCLSTTLGYFFTFILIEKSSDKDSIKSHRELDNR